MQISGRRVQECMISVGEGRVEIRGGRGNSGRREKGEGASRIWM